MAAWYATQSARAFDHLVQWGVTHWAGHLALGVVSQDASNII